MMQKRLFIFLHNTDPLITSWVLRDSAGVILQAAFYAPLEAIEHTDAFVLVPTENVLLTEAHLPKLNHARLMQALPFALEEQLLDEIENLHFAISHERTEQTVPTAVVSKQKMEDWLAALKTVFIEPAVLTPLVFALPDQEVATQPVIASKARQSSIEYALSAKQNTNTGLPRFARNEEAPIMRHENVWHIMALDNMSIVRTGKCSGFSCDNHSSLLESEFAKEKTKIYSNDSLQTLLENFNPADTPINLLQGPYRAKRKTTQTKKLWTIASSLVLSWIVLVLIGNTISFFILKSKFNHIETAIHQIYKHNFPQATAVTAPKERMQQKLKMAFAQTHNNNFLALLSLVAKSNRDGIQLNHLEFREKQLTLDVSSNHFDTLDTFVNSLTHSGLNVKRQSATTMGSVIKATLLITAGDA